ncbi:MAG: alpha/beta fold hydrolase [Caldilineaceae bacterium]
MMSTRSAEQATTPALTILVPGFGDNEGSLQPLVRFLARRGMAVQPLSPQPSDGALGIDELAQQLHTMIEASIPPTQPINLVGFSMGGLICRYYVQAVPRQRRICRLITIATPHHGTWTAYTFQRPASIQMRPGSPFLVALNQDLSPLAELAFTSIWTPFDLTILPPTSSSLPVGEMVTIFSPFHKTLLIDPQVLHAVAQRLQQ